MVGYSHYGMEIVVDDNHVGGFFANVGAVFAHGNADVGSFEGNAIVHSVAGHSDNVAAALQ